VLSEGDRRDTTYFTRNRMKVYDKNGLQVNPHQVNWGKYAEQEESKVECFLKADATMAHRTIVSRESPPGRSIVQIYGMIFHP